ncbi:MAG: hypothetical protein Q9198_002257 [Flavoplaca austrocitrina]
MDPFSITAGVVGLLDCVTRLSFAINRFKDDYRLADADLDTARQHALLLQEEIKALESTKARNCCLVSKTGKRNHDIDNSVVDGHLSIEETSFVKAVSTTHELLSTIKASFPLRAEPHTWRSKVRWVLKDKHVLVQLKEQLKTTESTLQGIVAMEQLRVSNVIYKILLQQQATLDRIGKEGLSKDNIFNMAMIHQNMPQLLPSNPQTEVHRDKTKMKQSTQLITKPTKSLPWILRLDRQGFSAQVVALPREKGSRFQAAVHLSLFGKIYSIQLHFSYPDFSSDTMLHVRNIVPNDSAMIVACRTGDFDTARQLLTSGSAHGNDTTVAGWPMLDYAIESGSARIVRLLLEYGAHPDMVYGEHNMTALQSCFLRGNLDIARILLTRGADIEHVDADGYSVLSYLWVVDSAFTKSVDFMRLCLANEFSEVNACDSRGWSAFQRAAAIGTPEDVDAFLKLGASLDLRAEWYGWTALFFAASHDNVETFLAIVRQSRSDVYESLDGDGWTLLHCCIYFGAPRVMRLVLLNGLNVNQLTHPAPLPEDPDLSYRELTPTDIALYIGPTRYQMFMEALVDTGRDIDREGYQDIFWDTATVAQHEDGKGAANSHPIYGAEDVDDDRWTLLHWASYNGSAKVKKLLLLKGVDPEHQDAIELEENPTILTKSYFEGR